VNVAGRHRFTTAVLFTWLPTTMQMDSPRQSRHDTDNCPQKDTVPIVPRVVLADDQKEILQTVALILGDEFRVVGTAENGMDAVDLTTRFCPDVVVLDVCMPVENGIDAACHIRDLGSKTRVIFLTVNNDPEFVEAAMSAGALGYILKQSLAAELVPAIWAVMRGNIFISPSIQAH
jgi:DNA-binding NarL/FixJ family response regulator